MVTVVGFSQFLKTLSLFLTASEIAHHRISKLRASKLKALSSSRVFIFDSDTRDDFERLKKNKALSSVASVYIASDLETLRLPKSFDCERDQLLICNTRDLREILKVMRVCDDSHSRLEKISRVLSHELNDETRRLLPSLTRLEGQIFHILNTDPVSRGISAFQDAGLPINAHRLRDHVLTLRRKLVNTRFEIQTVKDVGYRLNFGLESSDASRENSINGRLPSLQSAGEFVLKEI